MEEKKCYIARHWDAEKEKTFKLSAKEKAIIEWFLDTMDLDSEGVYLEEPPAIYEFEG